MTDAAQISGGMANFLDGLPYAAKLLGAMAVGMLLAELLIIRPFLK